MLLELRVKNFALIESLQISFGEKFNVLTGETGAGKTIFVTGTRPTMRVKIFNWKCQRRNS